MGKWLHKTLTPNDPTELGPHVGLEDLACLIDGRLGGDERKDLLRHLNACGQCYRILQETMKDTQAAPSRKKTPLFRWKRKSVYALAASIALLVLIGGPLFYKFQSGQNLITSAELILDNDLREILLEDDTLEWSGSRRITRLMSALQKKGYHLKSFDRVVLANPYYQVKSIFGPEEILHIRIDGNVAYLEIREMK
jgi:hypothetical protein